MEWETVAESGKFRWEVKGRGDGVKYSLRKVTKKNGRVVGSVYVAQSRGSAVGIAERHATQAREKDQ